MILDGLLLFTGGKTGVGNSDGATDSPTTTTNSSMMLDFGGPALPKLAANQGARDMGIGDDPALKILIIVTTTFANATNMSIALQGAPDNGSGAAGSFVTWWTSPAYLEAVLVQGARLMDMDFPRPPEGVYMPRFVQLLYTISGTHNAGALEGAVVLDRFDQPYAALKNETYSGYPAGITVAN